MREKGRTRGVGTRGREKGGGGGGAGGGAANKEGGSRPFLWGVLLLEGIEGL